MTAEDWRRFRDVGGFRQFEPEPGIGKTSHFSKRLGEGIAPRTTGTLLERCQEIIRLFDAETKDYAFGDSGDAENYAAEMADLLEQWVKVGTASIQRHPSNQDPT